MSTLWSLRSRIYLRITLAVKIELFPTVIRVVGTLAPAVAIVVLVGDDGEEEEEVEEEETEEVADTVCDTRELLDADVDDDVDEDGDSEELTDLSAWPELVAGSLAACTAAAMAASAW